MHMCIGACQLFLMLPHAPGLQFNKLDYVVASVENMDEAVQACASSAGCRLAKRLLHCRVIPARTAARNVSMSK